MRQRLDSLRYSIAREATREGGYLGGASAIELQLPRGSFRKGVDVDIYFRKPSNIESFKSTILRRPSKVESFAPKILRIAKMHYERKGMNPNRLILEKAMTHIKVKDTETKTDVADIGYRSGKDRIVNVHGIRARHYNQIARDKRAILKHESHDSPKYKKAYSDIRMIDRVEHLRKRKSILGGKSNSKRRKKGLLW